MERYNFSVPPLTHLAIIMDGNGRWAKKKGLPRYEGHKKGAEVAKLVVEECVRLKIKCLTLYAFSKENWQRPKEEVNFLFDLLCFFLKKELKNLQVQKIKLNILGDVEGLPDKAQSVVREVCEATKDNDRMILNLALNYSGREEIIRACRRILEDKISPSDIDERLFRSYLYTSDQPDPDLIIRTSGEMRLSNYLLFQSAYSELYFTKTLWPDFTKEDLYKALEDFSKRERRFGRI